jgi:hypothetical protein
MSRMDGPVQQVLTLELTTTAEPIAGVVRSGNQAQAFSGWSELFAVLQTLTSQAGGDANAPAHRAGGRRMEDNGPARPA